MFGLAVASAAGVLQAAIHPPWLRDPTDVWRPIPPGSQRPWHTCEMVRMQIAARKPPPPFQPGKINSFGSLAESCDLVLKLRKKALKTLALDD